MPYLKLVEIGRDRVTESRESVVSLGRDPASTVAFTGDEAKVVSAHHAELRYAGGEWCIADVGSRNGTFLNGRRVAAEMAVHSGDVISLGESGPRLSVAAAADLLETTHGERAVDVRPYGVSLLAARTGQRYEARGTRIRLGRGRECEIQPAEASHTNVSRVHAELTVAPTGGLVLRDAGSKNGTFLNGERVREPTPVRLGDKIMLGHDGPVLIIEGMGTAPLKAVPPPRPQAPGGKTGGLGSKTVRALIADALAKAREERRHGRRGSTAFLKAVAEEVGKDSRRKIRWLSALVGVLVLLLAGGAWGVHSLLSLQAERTRIALRTAEDSARAELERLRRELAEARTAAAPATEVEQLRAQLDAAQARTTALQAALKRAHSALSSQLQAGEARRLDAQREVQRLREELAAAERRAPSPGLIDSLRRAVTAAEAQTANLDAKILALRGTDFAGLAQQTQAAVGLVTAKFGREYVDGTGFVISADGYMLTNWHVVADSADARPDTLWVTMADQAVARHADVVTTSRERDLALLRIRGHLGAHLSSVDWSGTHARQGEPAAVIGFPAGAGFARDCGAVVRTSMTAGILSRVTGDLIQFDGMTTGGSSGSPVFNASGEVISVHRAGLRQGPGFALSVPVKYAIPLLPAELKRRLPVSP